MKNFGPAWEDSQIYYQYIKDINKYPLLTREQEKLVLLQVQAGNKLAMNKLVCSNLKFVINVAFLYRGQGFALPDLINEGNIGLIEAARRFDVHKKIRFISYAVWWIRQSITRALAEKARVVRISAEKELLIRRFNKHNRDLKQTIGGSFVADSDKLGKKMGFSSTEVEKILEMSQSSVSMDSPVGNDNKANFVDLFEDVHGDCPDLRSIINSQSEFLQNKLSSLCSLEQRVISLYFGLGTDHAMSLESIGSVIGLSKERVRQIKENALLQLRQEILLKELELCA